MFFRKTLLRKMIVGKMLLRRWFSERRSSQKCFPKGAFHKHDEILERPKFVLASFLREAVEMRDDSACPYKNLKRTNVILLGKSKAYALPARFLAFTAMMDDPSPGATSMVFTALFTKSSAFTAHQPKMSSERSSSNQRRPEANCSLCRIRSDISVVSNKKTGFEKALTDTTQSPGGVALLHGKRLVPSLRRYHSPSDSRCNIKPIRRPNWLYFSQCSTTILLHMTGVIGSGVRIDHSTVSIAPLLQNAASFFK